MSVAAPMSISGHHGLCVHFHFCRVKLVRVGHPARLLPQVLESALDAQVLNICCIINNNNNSVVIINYSTLTDIVLFNQGWVSELHSYCCYCYA